MFTYLILLWIKLFLRFVIFIFGIQYFVIWMGYLAWETQAQLNQKPIYTAPLFSSSQAFQQQAQGNTAFQQDFGTSSTNTEP